VNILKPKIVAMYRIKNEERWIKKSIESILDVCSEIVVLDESTDNTLEICRGFDQVVDIHRQSNLPFDDTRDKNTLLKMTSKLNPDFLLTLDGDEIIMPHAAEILQEELNILYTDNHVFEFEHLYMWDKPNQYRYDGFYSNAWRKKLFRMKDQPKNLHFEGTGFPGNNDCPHVPQNALGWDEPIRSKVKILHYGNYDEALRQNKYKMYNNRDPRSPFDGYKHIISGDGKFSGPNGMEFRLLPEGYFIPDI